MKFYSTKDKSLVVDLEEAVFSSLAPKNGLYMPCNIPKMDKSQIAELEDLTFSETMCILSSHLLHEDLSNLEVDHLIQKSITFPAPLKSLGDRISSLELWHGPSMAFKDFGARFMAGLMSHFIEKRGKHELTILVATSGDTGGAVAAGFYKTLGIKVYILFPKGKVSEIQRQQLTTFGENITAIEVEGTFDDCQHIVKTAFLDPHLNEKYRLSSANSINIARLIPQSFYYFEAYKQINEKDKCIVFSTPSGNFGNLTAGLLAQKIGLPINRFIAATNINHIVPSYLETGSFRPQPSIATISNAMDVGNPSNFERILELFDHNIEAIRSIISGFWLNDEDTKAAMVSAFNRYNYICDPHGAIGFQALSEGLRDGEYGVFLETAHPVKFLDTVNETLGINLEIPERIKNIMSRKSTAVQMSNNYVDFKDWMLSIH